MDLIHQENPCTYKIMRNIVYFSNQGIPFELIKAAAMSEEAEENAQRDGEVDEDSDLKSSKSKDEDDLLEAATRLKEFSFLRFRNVRNDVQSYEMHKLVQEATRYSLCKDKNEGLQFPKRALEIILQVFPISNHNTWDRRENFLPHALAVSAWPEVSKEKLSVSQLLGKVSMYLFHQGRSREKEAVDLKHLKLRQKMLGEGHPDTIMTMTHLAMTYYQQGRSMEAEQIYLDVLELRKEMLGERHPDTIWSMADLAATNHQQGRSAEAEQIFLDVLELRKKSA